MLAKFKLTTAAAVLAAILFVGGVSVIRRQEIRLNRTLRSVALRVLQVETLSRTRQQVYRMEFWNNRFLVDFYDEAAGRWERERDIAFPPEVMTPGVGTRLFFSRGRLERFEGDVRRGQKARYLLLELRVPGTAKVRSLIFYEGGDWRIVS
jgi:hypothetical protein